MPLNKRLREIMVPVSRYATTNEDASLKEAILRLREIYCETETGECTEAGHRTCLVFDRDSNLVGIIDFQSIFKTLIPEIVGGIGEKLASLKISVALSEGNAKDKKEITANLTQRVLSHGEIRVGDMMLRVRGKGVQADDFLIEGLKAMHRLRVTVMPVYEGNTLVGVLRDSDLFLTLASTFDQ